MTCVVVFRSRDSFCIGSLVSYTLCPHHPYTMIQTLLIYLNLNLIQTSTCYNSCCSISVARDPLCILDHMRHPIGIIHTPFSCWHAIHLEFINAVVKILYRWIFTVDSLEFTFHRSLSSTSTPLHFKAFCFCFVAKTLVIVLLFFVLSLWCDCLFEFLCLR